VPVEDLEKNDCGLLE